jgi:hypothetical protein
LVAEIWWFLVAEIYDGCGGGGWEGIVWQLVIFGAKQ